MRLGLLMRVLVVALFAAARPLAATPLTAETQVTTPAGATFTAPAGWSLDTTQPVRILAAPEGDARIAVIDGITAADPAAATAEAWHRYRPDFRRAAKLTTPRAPRDGWDTRAIVDYETSPNEKLTLFAYAVRASGLWTVALIESSDATMDKRAAAVSLVTRSLRAPGYSRETFAGRTPQKLDPPRVAALLDFVRDGMRQLDVPGVGIALIQDGKVVYEGGLGVKRLGSPEPVDAHSRFMIASNTKGMSTLMLATLVDDGKLAWDRPVVEIYPAFRLGDDATTRKVLLRHLVCACTGLPRKDYDWIFNTRRDTKPGNVFKLLAGTQPTSGFGEVFQYNNLITTAGGLIGGLTAYPGLEPGAAYDRAMRERIFGPLGMADTTFSFETAIAGNHASPHGYDANGKVAVSSHDLAWSIVPYRPAGGAWSSAHDVARYAMLELSQGVLPDGRRVVSAANLLERRRHGVPTGEDVWYGMGLFEDRGTGVAVVEHGGSMPGYMSNFYVVPDAGVAAVLLTNSDSGNTLLAPFKRRLLELLYDGKPEAAAQVAAAAAANKALRDEDRTHLTLPPDAKAVNALASGYTNADLGRIRVTRSGGSVRFEFTDWSSAMATRANEDGTLSFVTVDPSIDGIPFVVGMKDGKRTLSTRDSQHDYLFVEAAQ